MTENNISPSYTSLVEWFSSKEKNPKDWRIGTEHEKFIFSLDEQKPVAYEGDAGIEAILRYFGLFGASLGVVWARMFGDF